MTMAQAVLNDGQSLLAVNDLFIGQKTHTSARYRVHYNQAEEEQSSSGIIVSTGAGSTGWNRSIVVGASGIVQALASKAKVNDIRDNYRFDWESRYLVFNVREPFPSKTSGAEIVHGKIEPKKPLEIVSLMPQNGVIFSDGIEEDRLEFNSGTIARIGLAERTLRLVVPQKRVSDQTTSWTGAEAASAPDRQKHERRACPSRNSPAKRAPLDPVNKMVDFSLHSRPSSAKHCLGAARRCIADPICKSLNDIRPAAPRFKPDSIVALSCTFLHSYSIFKHLYTPEQLPFREFEFHSQQAVSRPNAAVN